MEKIIEWAENELTTLGYTLLEAPQMIRSMPWSTVWGLKTSEGKVYLKSMAENFSYEGALVAFLTQHEIHHIPTVIAIHPNNHCFLMKDAGEPLLPVLKANYNLPLIEKALKTYASMQLKCITFKEKLLDIGVMDLRLRKLPALFEIFLDDSELGFKSDDIKKLRKSKSAFEEMCHTLNAIGIPETLEQGDFTDDNLLIKNNEIIFNDFGDAMISHPFFSIVAFLNGAQNEHSLNQTSLNHLRDIYLGEWNEFAAHEKLIQAFAIANKLIPFLWALCLKRMRSCPGIDIAEYDVYVEKVMSMWAQVFSRTA